MEKLHIEWKKVHKGEEHSQAFQITQKEEPSGGGACSCAHMPLLLKGSSAKETRIDIWKKTSIASQ